MSPSAPLRGRLRFRAITINPENHLAEGYRRNAARDQPGSLVGGVVFTEAGGQVLLLDGSQPMLRHLGWLIDLFREPYPRIYTGGCIQG